MSDEFPNDIAIVGMAIRVSDAATPDQFWANLANGVESVREYSDEELLAKGVSKTTLADRHYVKAGIPLQNLESFDPEFFGFSPKEAAILDPQHRHFYELCWEALERASHPPESFDGAIGIFAGCGMGSYFAFNLLTNPELVKSVGLFLLRHTGNDKDFLATRVSYAFNLNGPSVNVQTACSTSLVATHVAVQSLLSRECDMALAGGVTIELPHGVGYHYKEGEVLSPDGHCRSFDKRSKGTVFGSGAGVVVLRRMADAIRDGDHIHAVIKGSAVNNDGSRKVGYLAPSIDGQAACATEALALADFNADTVSYVECHGTATPVGDPIEIAALTQAFRATTKKVGFCRVGSVKTNIGHLDTAAGVVSLIKATLALENRKIPPSLNFESPNPQIDFEKSPFRVASALADWASDGPRRAGVNSLGVGGTNAFVVLEEAPKRAASPADDSAQVLVLSARNRKSLDEASQSLATWLRQNPNVPLADVAYTLKAGRHGFDQRRVLAAKTSDEAADLLERADGARVFTHTKELDRPSVVFLFPGGGAQYVQMGRGLYEREPVFREHVDRGLAILKSRFGTDLESVLLPQGPATPELAERLAKPSAQLPLTFLVEYALAKLLETYGITPEAVIGHSMGENTAACVAGVFSFEDALGLLALRGRLVEEAPAGSMIGVPVAAEELLPYLGDTLDLASANSPLLSVASGPDDLIQDLSARLAAKGIDSKNVRVRVAAHSRLLDGILPQFRKYLQSIVLHEPRVRIISNFTGQWLDPAQARDPEYWVRHLRNTIQFAKGIETLLESDKRVFLEVGPGTMLGSFVRQNPKAPAQRVLSSMRHPEDTIPDHVHFRTVLGRLWAVGVDFDAKKVWGEGRKRIPLPTYAFQRARFWIEPGTGATQTRDDEHRPPRIPEWENWFRSPKWVQQGVLASSESTHTWLVFGGDDAPTKALEANLRDGGHTVISIRPGDTFTRHDDTTYTVCPEAGGAGYQELIDSLREREIVPDRVLHAWLLTSDRTFRPGSSFFNRNQERGFYSLFHLIRALSKGGLTDKGLHLTVVANGTQRVGDEAVTLPDKTTALGPCLVIPREFPNVTCAFVDVEYGPPPRGRWGRPVAPSIEPLVRELAEELRAAPSTRVIAWRKGVRWQRHLGPARPAPAAPTPRLREGGVYLITGGFGGIGSVLAEWLAKDYRAKLVLLGRTPVPPRTDWDDWLSRHPADDAIAMAIRQIQKLERLGATVQPVAADVAVAEQMKDAVAQARSAFGDIHGVFHTAGLIRDRLIQLKSPREIEDVFSAKVYGTLILDEVLRELPLDFLILFSSTSAAIGPGGQIDYAGANAFIEAFADSCTGQRPYPVTAIAWGIWNEIGMTRPATGRAGAAIPDHHCPPAESLSVESGHFDRRYASRDGVAQTHTLTGTLSATRDWVIDEHRLAGGEALLPGTGYLELVRAALGELGNRGPWALGNLVFEAPLFVGDEAPVGFRVALRGDEQRWDVEISAEGGRCATARVTPLSADAPAPLRLSEIELRCAGAFTVASGASSLRTRQEDHLKFGPRWRCLKRLKLGSGEALAYLELPPAFASDLKQFGLHPGVMDIATGCAMDLIPGYASQSVTQNLWAPISYRGLRYYGPIETSVVSWIRYVGDGNAESEFAAFDVTITDDQGKVLVEVEQLTLRKLVESFRAPKPVVAVRPDGAEASESSAGRAKVQSPGELALQHNVSQGITPAEGILALTKILSGDLPSRVVVSSMNVDELMAQAEFLSRDVSETKDARFTRPELESDFEAPRDAIERQLAEVWGKLLGVEGVGIGDSFFDLGGHSLIAVRLFNEISEKFSADLPMSVLLQSPTIKALAALLRGGPYVEGGEAAAEVPAAEAKVPVELRYRHVVPMHAAPVAGRTPLFLVAGMFGNVLNLSHLAHLLGEDRPFYALQARGLFGDVDPHERFEEAATDYIAEILQVQSQGPYLLGGFSGGGLIAYEIAKQLHAAGHEILGVILLDTPAREMPQFTLADKFTFLKHDARYEGFRIIRKKIVNRINWEREKRNRRMETSDSKHGNTSFQSQRIGNAFLRGLAQYKISAAPFKVYLFRPKLNVKYRLGGGRLVDAERNYVREDNFWTPHVKSLEIFEVPGNHDNMVLEPNVRVLVSQLRRVIRSIGSGDV